MARAASAGSWREDVVLVPWIVMCGVLVLLAVVLFAVAWVARRAGSFIVALAHWTGERRW